MLGRSTPLRARYCRTRHPTCERTGEVACRLIGDRPGAVDTIPSCEQKNPGPAAPSLGQYRSSGWRRCRVCISTSCCTSCSTGSARSSRAESGYVRCWMRWSVSAPTSTSDPHSNASWRAPASWSVRGTGRWRVVGDDRRLVEFITHGLTPAEHAAIGNLPTGRLIPDTNHHTILTSEPSAAEIVTVCISA